MTAPLARAATGFSLLVTIFATATTGSATVQWSPNPATNTSVADGPSEQAQPKIAPTSDGGCYLSWFDSDPNGSPAFGYDVRLQRLDAAGRALWPHGGVLIADRGFSSTQDYDLDTDLFGNALLAFRDDRQGGTQITAAKVDPSGAQLWGATGVQLTNTTAFVAAPKIAGMSDGTITVAWSENADVHVMRLDPAGAPVWLADVVLSSPPNNLAASDLHGSDAGTAILSMVRFGGFTAPRHLLAQKLGPTGSLLWGASHVAVFDGGSLQIGNFPTFVPDTAGGAVFGWYSNSPALECRAQRILSTGTELFPHNGVTASTDVLTDRVNPDVAFDPSTQSTYLVYREENVGQFSVKAQRFDVTGARLWTGTGTLLTGPTARDYGDFNALFAGGDLHAFWTGAPAFGQDVVRSARVDAAGTVVGGMVDVSSTPATKYRVQTALSSFGFALVAWQDEGAGSADILAQNVLPTGTLGGVASTATRNGTGLNPTCYTNVTPPALGTDWVTQVAHAPTDSATATFLGVLPATGPVAPGIGELLVDVSIPTIYSNIETATGTADTHTLQIPAQIGLVGITFATQALVVDSGLGLTLCNAIDITIGL